MPSKYQDLADALAQIDVDKAMNDKMEARKKLLDKTKGKKIGGMFDIIYGRRRAMETAINDVDQ